MIEPILWTMLMVAFYTLQVLIVKRILREEREMVDDGIIRGEDADRIIDEIENGTPNTPKRVETIERAQRVFEAHMPGFGPSDD